MVKKTGKVKKYFIENWVSILLLLIVIVLLIIGIIYSQKGCGRKINGNNSNFEFFDTNSSDECFVMFYAPWCGYCKKVMPEWNKLEQVAVKNSKGKKIKIIKINCDENKELAAKHGIQGYPTLKYYNNGINGGNSINFNGDRDMNGFIDFIKQQ